MKRYSDRLHAVIPGGAHTYSRGDDQFPEQAPPILARGKGAYVWDPDGRRYLDYGMALRAVTLGYADERVNSAAWRQADNGVNLTRASVVELEAAELLVDLIPSFEMVKFAKNGSNVTTAAVKIARAYTGRRYVCIPRQHPFFSFDDWFIGTTPIRRGVPADQSASTLSFDYGDLESLRTLFLTYPGQIAAVMMEPATTELPCASACATEPSYKMPCASCPNRAVSFLHSAQSLCQKEGALFILDEMITGFRWHLQGAQTFFGLEPDLTTFGKGMANGFALAAVGGKREFMKVGATNRPGEERTFLLSSTHGAEMPALGAFIETVAVYKEFNVVRHLWDYSERLRDGITELTRKHGVETSFRLIGPPISMSYQTLDGSGANSMLLRTLFAQELARSGVLMPWIAVSLAHGQDELGLTLSAVDSAFAVYRRALEDGVERFLEGSAIKPVFRRFN